MELYYVKRIQVISETNFIDGAYRTNDWVYVQLFKENDDENGKKSVVQQFDCYKNPEWRLVNEGDVVMSALNGEGRKEFTPLFVGRCSQEWLKIQEYLKKHPLTSFEKPKDYLKLAKDLLVENANFMMVSRILFTEESIHHIGKYEDDVLKHRYCYVVLDHSQFLKIDTHDEEVWALLHKNDVVYYENRRYLPILK